uniref:Uncharacterized protein n=1 Tax=Rousettus aegyptiacus TaxID=9407 RepID=A0A7J8BEG8_ROUAE|nr:hypothetical protein HJG63_009739 [Rousettus aegyptiacus]
MLEDAFGPRRCYVTWVAGAPSPEGLRPAQRRRRTRPRPPRSAAPASGLAVGTGLPGLPGRFPPPPRLPCRVLPPPMLPTQWLWRPHVQHNRIKHTAVQHPERSAACACVCACVCARARVCSGGRPVSWLHARLACFLTDRINHALSRGQVTETVLT